MVVITILKTKKHRFAVFGIPLLLVAGIAFAQFSGRFTIALDKADMIVYGFGGGESGAD